MARREGVTATRFPILKSVTEYGSNELKRVRERDVLEHMRAFAAYTLRHHFKICE